MDASGRNLTDNFWVVLLYRKMYTTVIFIPRPVGVCTYKCRSEVIERFRKGITSGSSFAFKVRRNPQLVIKPKGHRLWVVIHGVPF